MLRARRDYALARKKLYSDISPKGRGVFVKNERSDDSKFEDFLRGSSGKIHSQEFIDSMTDIYRPHLLSTNSEHAKEGTTAHALSPAMDLPTALCTNVHTQQSIPLQEEQWGWRTWETL